MATKHDAPSKHRSTVLANKISRRDFFIVAFDSAANASHFLGEGTFGPKFFSAFVASVSRKLVYAIYVDFQLLVDVPAWVSVLTIEANQ